MMVFCAVCVTASVKHWKSKVHSKLWDAVLFSPHMFFLDPHCDVADKVGQGQVRVLPTGTC